MSYRKQTDWPRSLPQQKVFHYYTEELASSKTSLIFGKHIVTGVLGRTLHNAKNMYSGQKKKKVNGQEGSKYFSLLRGVNSFWHHYKDLSH